MSKIIRQIISTKNAAQPEFPFNQAIVANGTVYLSGCVGCDKDTMELVEGGVVPEMAKALEHVKAVLEAAGSSVENVVKATIFVQDLGDFAKVNEEYKKVFTKDFPARTCVQVAKLPLNAKVEIEIIALTGDVETLTIADDVEVVKAVSPDEIAELNDNPDQVALESIDSDASASIHLPHSQPAVAVNRANIGLGQPFGPPPPPHLAYHGPPPPIQGHHHPNDIIPNEKHFALPSSNNELWASPITDTPKIISLDVKCEKGGMKVFIQFDKPFYGIVFSKGHYSNVNCVHLPAGLGRSSATFDIGIHACGTAGNTENGLYGYGSESGSGTYFENIVVIQYDPQVQEVWDQARKLRCTWHDQYEKSVTFRPFPVDMLDVVRADFAGDNVGCWMQIQVGKGPWASEVSGLVKIGQTMTMVLAIKDDDSKFDMLVRNCMAHDGKRAPIQLVDQRGCVTRPKLMSRFTKIKNFGASASVLSYAHFQAFKFPDSMEVHFQCTIQICRYQCPDQCSDPGNLDVHHLVAGPESQYGPPPPLPLEAYLHGVGRPRDERRVRRTRSTDPQKEIGLNRIIKVVSSGDLTFAIDEQNSTQSTMVFPLREEGLICMTTPGFTITLVVLLGILFTSCLISAYLYVRLRPFSMTEKERAIAFTAAPHPVSTVQQQIVHGQPKKRYCFYS